MVILGGEMEMRAGFDWRGLWGLHDDCHRPTISEN